MTMTTKAFKANKGKHGQGFTLKFNSGWIVSTQWGIGLLGDGDCNAEIGVWHSDDDHDVAMTIHGWKTPDDLAEILAAAASGNSQILRMEVIAARR